MKTRSDIQRTFPASQEKLNWPGLLFAGSALLAFLLFIATPALTQNKKHEKDSKNVSIDLDKGLFNPLIFPGYTPEMGFNVGGGALW